MIALFHLRHSHFDVLLSRTRDQELFGLSIAEEAQHRILFHQLVNADAKFVFVGPALRLNGKGDCRLRQLHWRVLNRRCLLPQGVTCQCVFQFRDGSNITCVKFVHRNSGLSLHDRKVRQLLLRVPREILNGRVILQHP